MGAQPTLLMVAAAEARVFDKLGENEMSSTEIAKATNLDGRATRLVLDGLVGIGILKKKNGYYRNTSASLSHLRVDTNQSHAVRHWISGTRLWEHLPYILRTGKLPETGDFLEPWKQEEQENNAFIRSMYDLGWMTAQNVTDSLDLTGVKHFVDLGGGPGHYTIAALERSPEISATLVDLPLTLLVANTSLIQRGLLKRTKLVECDLFDFSKSIPILPETADIVLISNVLHMEGPERNVTLIKRAAQLLSPSGKLIIHEMILDEDRTHPQASSLFAVHLLAMTQRGELYPTSVICDWLSQAGLKPRVIKTNPFLIEGERI
jgi:SAM-dependent methyltransferase